ncbi:MAG: nuclear transport factor 2 family protein [Armatimonadetes bacterium]|nr:nuclear transport factor 2 family protein [Armatimonadota bacterium]
MRKSMKTLEKEILDTLETMLEAVFKGDVETYRQHTAGDISSFEWYIAPYRIDTLDFHLNLLAQAAAKGPQEGFRFDILTPRVQLLSRAAVVTYSLLVTRFEEGQPVFETTNETRVFSQEGSRWVMVHLHKSPAAG